MSRFVAFDVETPNRVSNTKSDRRKCLSLIWISECAEVLNRSPIRRLINLIVVAQKKLDFRIYVYTTFDTRMSSGKQKNLQICLGQERSVFRSIRSYPSAPHDGISRAASFSKKSRTA